MNWLHFLFRVSPGHLTLSLFARKRIERVSVCQPPYPCTFSLLGHPSSQGTEHSLGTCGVTSQSATFSGGGHRAVDRDLRSYHQIRAEVWGQKSNRSASAQPNPKNPYGMFVPGPALATRSDNDATSCHSRAAGRKHRVGCASCPNRSLNPLSLLSESLVPLKSGKPHQPFLKIAGMRLAGPAP